MHNIILLPLSSLLISYLFGSIPSGYLAGIWVSGKDLREIGSGSTGATNVLRHIGRLPALIVLFVDIGKGIIAILIARSLELDESWQVASGIAALSGHIWPIWLKGKGGKAVATGLGIFLGIAWEVGVGALVIFLIVLSLWRIVSLSSICAALSLPILMFLSFQGEFSIPYIFISLIAMTMVLWRHRTNINRLIKGEEPQIGKKA